jgi:hypothetical protein
LTALAGAALAYYHPTPKLTSRSEVPEAALKRPFRLYDLEKKMPDRADQYDGINETRPVDVVADEYGAVHVFVIGDWGASLPGHCTFPCNGYEQDAQYKVAGAMKHRATWAKPQYVLNVGDNLYVQGLDHNCDMPPNDRQWDTEADFNGFWVEIYGPVAEIPWLSVLGNHDYGGWRGDKGWPQQIGYSFINYNWILPARYYMKRIHHPGFYIDYFMYDSQAFDAKHMNEGDQDHNLCSAHNYGGPGQCASNGGMPSIEGCVDWFWDSMEKQKEWLVEKIAASDATWKIINTHFPCGYDTEWFKKLKKEYGLDLLVTGHRHQQELWWPGSPSTYVQATMERTGWDRDSPACFVSGGGGGILAQNFGYADYGTDLANYGFFDLTITKDQMLIEAIDWDGNLIGNITNFHHGSKEAEEIYNLSLKSQSDN